MTSNPQSFLIKNALKHMKQEEKSTKQALYEPGRARILVVGTGGGGNNTVKRIKNVGIYGAECIAINTDQQHLDDTVADHKLLIGPNTTRGLGAGGYPPIGEAAAEESKEVLRETMAGADLVFLAAGLGGGTGTGSAPIIARIAKEELGAIVVGVVTMPFQVENARMEKAKDGLEKLRQFADTVVVVDNDRLLDYAQDMPVKQAFATADEILASMVKGITETISQPSLINLDYADVRTILRGGGVAMVGVGEAEGSLGTDRIDKAVTNALDCPLLSLNINGASGALIHVTGGSDMTLGEATRVPELIAPKLDPQAEVIWGARIAPEYGEWIRVILIVTGVDSPCLLGKHSSPFVSSNITGFSDVNQLVNKQTGLFSIIKGSSPNNPRIDLGIGKKL